MKIKQLISFFSLGIIILVEEDVTNPSCPLIQSSAKYAQSKRLIANVHKNSLIVGREKYLGNALQDLGSNDAVNLFNI